MRELRQYASQWLRRVAQGESFEVTGRGRRVDLLIPPPREDGLEGPFARGRAAPGTGYLGDLAPPRTVGPGALSERGAEAPSCR